MGLRFLRSISFGLVRFNFSNKGIGVSFVVPGLGAGVAMRGAYIRGGIGQFEYRRSITAGVSGVNAPAKVARVLSHRSLVEDANVFNTLEHEDKSVLQLQDSTRDALLQSMNEQIDKRPLWPLVAAGLLALFVGLQWMTAWPVVLNLLMFAALTAITGWIFWRDQLSKLTVLFYEPDQAGSELFDQLCDGLRKAAGARKLQSVATTSRYLDTKYSAGAGQAVQLGKAKLSLGHAPCVLANVRVPILSCDRTVLAFYPDRILAFQGRAVGSIDYATFSAVSSTIRFIEDGGTPADAAVVANTWRFVNKDGGPDLRFKDNHQLPICVYSQLTLSTKDGLDVRLIGSRQGGFDGLVGALANLGARGVIASSTDDARWGEGRELVFRATR